MGGVSVFIELVNPGSEETFQENKNLRTTNAFMTTSENLRTIMLPSWLFSLGVFCFFVFLRDVHYVTSDAIT